MVLILLCDLGQPSDGSIRNCRAGRKVLERPIECTRRDFSGNKGDVASSRATAKSGGSAGNCSLVVMRSRGRQSVALLFQLNLLHGCCACRRAVWLWQRSSAQTEVVVWYWYSDSGDSALVFKVWRLQRASFSCCLGPGPGLHLSVSFGSLELDSLFGVHISLVCVDTNYTVCVPLGDGRQLSDGPPGCSCQI